MKLSLERSSLTFFLLVWFLGCYVSGVLVRQWLIGGLGCWDPLMKWIVT